MSNTQATLRQLAVLFRSIADAKSLAHGRSGAIVMTAVPEDESVVVNLVDGKAEIADASALHGRVLLSFRGTQSGLKSIFCGGADRAIDDGELEFSADADFVKALNVDGGVSWLAARSGGAK